MSDYEKKDYHFSFVASGVGDFRKLLKKEVTHVLFSYYYIRKSPPMLHAILENPQITFIVDSGLYSFASGAKNHSLRPRDINNYIENYIAFIKKYHTVENIRGFFELDFDLIGFDYHTFVKPIQERLLEITDKIILICQKKRTLDDIEELCKQNIHMISIPFASQIERTWFDYELLIDKIHSYGKNVHLLGCSEASYLPLAESSDSSTWIKTCIYGSQLFYIDKRIKAIHWSESPLVDKDSASSRQLYSIDSFKEMEKDINIRKKTRNTQTLRLF